MLKEFVLSDEFFFAVAKNITALQRHDNLWGVEYKIMRLTGMLNEIDGPLQGFGGWA